MRRPSVVSLSEPSGGRAQPRATHPSQSPGKKSEKPWPKRDCSVASGMPPASLRPIMMHSSRKSEGFTTSVSMPQNRSSPCRKAVMSFGALNRTTDWPCSASSGRDAALAAHSAGSVDTAPGPAPA